MKNGIKKMAIITILFTIIPMMTFGIVLPVHAADEPESADAIADTTSHRSLTIWKYQVTESSSIGDRGDGTFDPTVDKKVIPGIHFTFLKVNPLPGKVLTDPKLQKAGSDYTSDPNFPLVTYTTDEEGKIYLDLGIGRNGDGIYLVQEQPDDRSDLSATDGKKVEEPADPFFVYVPQTNRKDTGKLIYDVQVQPKNVLENLVNPIKKIENDKGYSIQAGQDFEWELAAKVPSGLWQIASHDGQMDIYNADGDLVGVCAFRKGDPIVIENSGGISQPNFSMTDILDSQLTYLDNSAKVQVKKGETGEWENLAEEDYLVTFDSTTNTLKTSLTKAGLIKVGTTSNGYTDIQTVFTTKVAEGWNGILDNNFTVNYQIPGQKPKTVTPPEEEKPKYYTGGFDIEKTGEDTKAVLAGAEFMIALTKEDAEAGKFLASDGKAYDKGTTLPTGVTFQLAASDASGRAEFNGLALDWDDKNADKLVQEDEVSRTYWLVETKAPDGYELLKAPVEVKVDLSTAEDKLIELNIVDKPKTDLPFTGGEGTALLIVIALGVITVGTSAIVIDKKRHKLS